MSRAPLRVIWPGRSDGTGERPPPSKLQKITERNGTQRWLEEVAIDEAKSRDWRKKLGLMLIQEMEKKLTEESGQSYKVDDEEGMIYMLHDFPHGYTLYEQHTIKPSNKEGGQPEERRDAYLYGHPGGEKKRFRTPKEFFEHLWWLQTDEQGDPDNCTCPRCVPEDLHKEVEEFITGKQMQPQGTKTKPIVREAPVRPTSQAPTQRSTPALPPPAASAHSPAVQPAVNRPAALQPSSAPAPKPQPLRPASSGRAAPKSHLAPSQPPEPRNQEQADDSRPGSFLFRIGEVVWFQKGTAWGLGILVGRSQRRGESKIDFAYSVQPLSYPNANCGRAEIAQEAQVKPWYAYSPPNATHARLNQPDAIDLMYNQVPWGQVLSGELGQGDAEVDASIYAAKTVDRSYSPVDPVSSSEGRTWYNGVFIGAEKIWRGDAVRLRTAPSASNNVSNPEILIVTNIIENTSSTQLLGPDRPAPRESIFVTGDRYTFTQLQIKVPDGESNPQSYLQNRIPTRIPTLPDRVAEDLMHQNRISVMRHQTASSWRLIATNQQVAVSEIRGRWYESMRMLPIINPNLWQSAISMGHIPDVGRSLNARGDSGILSNGCPGFRFRHREAVLGTSVPNTFRLPNLVSIVGGSAPSSGRGTPNESVKPGLQTAAIQPDRMDIDRPGQVPGMP